MGKNTFEENLENLDKIIESLESGELSLDDAIKEYENEAESFWKFYDWENMNLTHLLHENNLNLLKDFHKTLKFLANYEISYYDFPPLAEMDLHTEESSTNFIK